MDKLNILDLVEKLGEETLLDDLVKPQPKLYMNRPVTLPVLPSRGLILFPELTIGIEVGREASLLAVEQSLQDEDRLIFLVSQIDPEKDEYRAKDLYRNGTIAKVMQVMKDDDNNLKVLLKGICTAKVNKFISTDYEVSAYRASVQPQERDDYDLQELAKISLTPELEELVLIQDRISKFCKYYAQVFNGMPKEAFEYILSCHSVMRRLDLISSYVDFALNVKQKSLEMSDIFERSSYVLGNLQVICNIRELEHAVEVKVQDMVDKQQREYYIREHIRMLEKELEDTELDDSDVGKLRRAVRNSLMPDQYKEQLNNEIDRLSRLPISSPEAAISTNWLESVIKLPYSCSEVEQLDIAKAKQILDRDHFGMEKVKERILEYIAVRKLQVQQGDTRVKGPILCLVGPPGVGKTSIARSIAEAVGRKYIRMSLGGIRDESEIRGHRKTYIGAMPGRIMQGISQIGTDNPLFLLDEIDKLGSDFRGDPSSALLEVLDPAQNDTFRDNYIEIPYDLSHVLFVTTANYADNIPEPLYDRMEIIQLNGYTEEEKLHIAQDHLIPKQIKENNLDAKRIKLSQAAIRQIISGYTVEAGVRQLEREIGKVLRKIAMHYDSESAEIYSVGKQEVEKYLGPLKFLFDEAEQKPEVGCARGLAWTYAGGDTLRIEVNMFPGKGNLLLTGQLGDVMKESARAALTYCRSQADTWKLPTDIFDKHDLHIHVPAGAVPKDGPSAGITMSTAIASALTGRPVRHDLAMTGEVSLRGKVMPIGGLKAKAVAAHRAKIKEILIPYDNKRDIVEIPESVKSKLKITPVKTMSEVIKIALLPK